MTHKQRYCTRCRLQLAKTERRYCAQCKQKQHRKQKPPQRGRLHLSPPPDPLFSLSLPEQAGRERTRKMIAAIGLGITLAVTATPAVIASTSGSGSYSSAGYATGSVNIPTTQAGTADTQPVYETATTHFVDLNSVAGGWFTAFTLWSVQGITGYMFRMVVDAVS